MAKLQTHAGVLAYFLKKPGASDSYPFGPGARVLKVAGKMFGLIGEGEEQLTLNLKCDPEDALALRAAYPQWVQPGYHMNKKMWLQNQSQNGAHSIALFASMRTKSILLR